MSEEKEVRIDKEDSLNRSNSFAVPAGAGTKRSRAMEKTFLNLASAATFGDERLVPAVFQEIAASFSISLSQLGFIALAGSLSQALAYPLAGIIGDNYYRGRMIAFSLIGIAFTTVLMAMSLEYWELIVAKALNGVCIGMLVPPLQSLVGDMHSPLHRGQAYGYLTFTGITGSIIGSALATILAAGVYFGVEGWRVALLIWVLFLAGLVVAMWFLALPGLDHIDREKFLSSSENLDKGWYQAMSDGAADAWTRMSFVLSIPTLQILIIPQAVGGIPWVAMTGWATFYLESLGFSNAASAILVLITGAGFGLGSLLGGLLGDYMETWDRYKGRIILAQCAIVMGVLVFLWILEILPWLCNGQDILTAGLAYAISLFAAGILSIGGVGAACNLPIIMSTLPHSHRTTGIAMERFFFSVIAAFGTPLVGLVAEYYFGDKLDDSDLIDPEAEGPEPEPSAPHPELFTPYANRNSVVLGHSLALVATVGWLLGAAVWFFLYWTYPYDRLALDEEEEGSLDGDKLAPRYGATGGGGLSVASVAGSSVHPTYQASQGSVERDDAQVI